MRINAARKDYSALHVEQDIRTTQFHSRQLQIPADNGNVDTTWFHNGRQSRFAIFPFTRNFEINRDKALLEELEADSGLDSLDFGLAPLDELTTLAELKTTVSLELTTLLELELAAQLELATLLELASLLELGGVKFATTPLKLGKRSVPTF